MNLFPSPLKDLKQANATAIIETPNVAPESINQAAYYARNSVIVDLSDGICAFQVNKSQGTEDTIDKAVKKGIPILVHKHYQI